MGLSQTELEEHCRKILAFRDILNKVVILCEGSIQELKNTKSPTSYRKMKKRPDANFYNDCVPSIWGNRRPVFINCGDRNDVLDTYFLVQELHAEAPEASFLRPKLLFALVDLDLQIKKIEDYSLQNTEEIFESIYQNFELKTDIIPEHRILTTGLIYKEAYFLLPDLQSFFSSEQDISMQPFYQEERLNLDDLYKDIIKNLNDDKNLCKNLKVAAHRLRLCDYIDCENIQKIQDSFKNCTGVEESVYPLFLVSQVKDYWRSLTPHQNHLGHIDRWREQLTLNIAKFYADSTNPRHHIPAILREIYNYVYG